MHSINATQGGISCHALSHIPFEIELVRFRSNSSFPPRSYGGGGVKGKLWEARPEELLVCDQQATESRAGKGNTSPHTLAAGGRFLGDICPMPFPPAPQELCQQVIRNQSRK